MENLEKPGTPEWKLIEHSRRHLEQVVREASGRMERDTEAMKEQARRHLANIEADAAGRRGPLRQSHVDAMREVEEQYPLDPKSEPDTWVGFAKLSPWQYIAPPRSPTPFRFVGVAMANAGAGQVYEEDVDPTTWSSGVGYSAGGANTAGPNLYVLDRLARNDYAFFYEQFAGLVRIDDGALPTGLLPSEPPTIKGKPAGRVRNCHHGNPRGRCRECSGVGRRR